MLKEKIWGPLVSLVWLCAASGMPAAANPFIVEKDPAEFTSSFALRYWYGFGSTSKDLYGSTRDDLVSRLSYTGLQSHSLEIFTRVDHASGGLFWKGYAGSGLLTQGSLQDEDLPPLTTPYSSTNSTLQNQSLGYISVDFGGALLRGPDFRIDGFVGYHYLHQRLKGFGCHQTAGNPDICAGGIADSVAVIVEDDTWQGVRLGLNADLPLADRWRLNLEAAYLPYVWFSGSDNICCVPIYLSRFSKTATAGVTSSRHCSHIKWMMQSALESAAAVGIWRAGALRISNRSAASASLSTSRPTSTEFLCKAATVSGRSDAVRPCAGPPCRDPHCRAGRQGGRDCHERSTC